MTLLTIAATAYCTLTYVAGFKLFNLHRPTRGTFLFWLFSPITVPLGLFLLMVAG